jgi:hypothetical protein
MSNLLKDASILLTPTGYDNGRMNAIKPYKDLYGPELVTNGDFSQGTQDWTFNTSGNNQWSVVNEKAVYNASSTDFIITNNVLTIGKKYLVSFDISDTNNSTIRLSVNSEAGGSFDDYTNGDGKYTKYITANTNYLRIGGSASGASFSIDNVSVVEDLTGDFTFSRNSAATRVNAQGLVENVQIISSELVSNGDFSQIGTEEVLNGNFSQEGSELVVNGDFSDSSWWGLDPVWSISNGSANCNGSGVIYKGGVLTIGKSYKVEVEISSYTSGTLTYPNASYTLPSAVGSYTFYYKANSQTVSFTGTNFIGSIDNVSVKEVTGQEVVPDSGCGSWLLEPQSTNLITYSEDFSNAAWTKLNSSITSNSVISPDGTLNADKLVEDTTTGEKFTQTITSVSNTTIYTASVFVKFAGREWIRFTDAQSSNRIHFNTKTGVFGLVTGTVINYESTLLSDGWYKLSLTTTSVTTAYAMRIVLAENDNDVSYTGDGTSGVYIYGAQLEQQSYATSYIPTNGATNTRLQDIANNSGNSTLINSTEGVLYAEIAALADDISGFRVLSISDGGSTNRIFIGYTSNNIYANVGAGTTIGSPYTPTNASNFHKVALKYENNNCKFFVDGSQIGSTTTSITIPSGMNSLQFDSGAGSSDFYGKVNCVAVYKEALTDAELQCLTTI